MVGASAGRAVCHDAVIVLPGIMGSELVEAGSGEILWGMAEIGWYLRAWTTGSSLAKLHVTEAERSGRADRVVARRLLRFPAFAPGLRGFEPYTDLLVGLRGVAAHPDAVLEFPYDWRLSVEHNAGCLADAAADHLGRWRRHPHGSRHAALVLVAHSMGGLIARRFTEVLGGEAEVRLTVTLGTPFYGAAKAAYIMGRGRGAPLPLPRRRLRGLAVTLPGLYDLLPAYRCVDVGGSTRHLAPADMAAVGADPELVTESFARRPPAEAGPRTARLRSVIGVEQPTMQSLLFSDGTVEGCNYLYDDGPGAPATRVDRRGDGTVYLESAAPPGAEPAYLPQTHGALPTAGEVGAHVRALLTARELGPPLGAAGIGLDAPDVVTAARPFTIRVTGQPDRPATDPAAVACQVVDVTTGRVLRRPLFRSGSQGLTAQTDLPRPGLYRIQVKSGGSSAVSDMVLATASETTAVP